MNITSFTSLDPNGAGNNEKNIDSSSTAHLTTSDSDPEASPSVTVLRLVSNSTHSNHHHLPRPSRLLAGGFHLNTKHQRTLWSRATHYEKLLLFVLLISLTISLAMFLFLGSIILRQKNELERLVRDEELGHVNLTSVVTGASGDVKRFCLTPDCVKVAASVIEAIDLTVDPCDDFYLYSCGDWIKSNPLPDGKSNWGTFSKLWQDNQAIMRSVLEDGGEFKSGSAEEKAKIYYESCLDRNDTVESRGTRPMQDLIESVSVHQGLK